MEETQDNPSILAQESSAQRQARLRRERREAKIKAGGSARLEQITQLSGRSMENAPSVSPEQPVPPTQLSSDQDPDEADISTYTNSFQQPGHSQSPAGADIRHLLRTGVSSEEQPAGEPADPMMQLLQQMMGGIPAAEENKSGAGNGLDGLPAGLAAMLGTQPPGASSSPASGVSASTEEGVSELLWKILHALSAVMLASYMTMLAKFNGSQSPRGTRASMDGTGDYDQRIFWIFATAELLLQSARFFLEGGKGKQSGWIGMMARIFPKPWSDYASLLGRYSRIWTTVVEDAMVVVFVLGCVAWWKGAVG